MAASQATFPAATFPAGGINNTRVESVKHAMPRADRLVCVVVCLVACFVVNGQGATEGAQTIAPGGVFCPSAAHYFSFDSQLPVDKVTWSLAKLQVIGDARYSDARKALVLASVGYAQFNWLEAGSTSLTIATWFMPDVLNGGSTVFSLGVDDANVLPYTSRGHVYASLLTTQPNTLRVGHVSYEGSDATAPRLEHYAEAPGVLAEGAWTHLAAVFDQNGTIAIYVNGTLRATNPGAAPVPYALRTSSYLGRAHEAYSTPFVGAFADFAIYYETLSEATLGDLVTGTPSRCAKFSDETNFTSLFIGSSAQGGEHFTGDMFDLEVLNYDVLATFLDTVVGVDAPVKTSTFVLVTVFTSLLVIFLLAFVGTMTVTMAAGRNTKLPTQRQPRAAKQKPANYKARDLML